MNYNIPIIWSSFRTYSVEAENLQEAVTKALKQFLSEPDEEYINDSFELDTEDLSESYPEEQIDYDKLYNEI